MIKTFTAYLLKALCLIFLGTAAIAFPMPSANDAPTPAAKQLQKADECKKKLYQSEKKKKYRDNWIKCAKKYEAVCEDHPKTNEAVIALYRAAVLYMNLHKYSKRGEELNSALTMYRKIADEYKTHSLADDAQYRIGEILYEKKNDPAQAYVEFLKVEIEFPHGDMRAKAKKMLDKLTTTLNQKKHNATSESGARGTVKDIRYWSTPNYTRVVVDVADPVEYEHHLLKADPSHQKPRRLYLDLKNARIGKKIDTVVPIKNDLLQKARAGQYTMDTVRVVLDMEKLGGYNVFHLYDPFRIVVDVRGFEKSESPLEKEEKYAKQKPVKGTKKKHQVNETLSLARQLGLNVKRIVIDPGHGGKDPGCESHGNYNEKNITLGIARHLAKQLRKKVGCEVSLTRDRDIFLSLEQRTAIANMKKADLFISLHVNSYKDERIHGLETYFLNMATDQRSVMLAARENATSEKNISDLQSILNDLILNTKIRESNRLAHEVQEGMIGSMSRRYDRIRSLGVKQAPFYVLIGAQMPAILVEVGFLSNYTERKRLMNKSYQERLAAGICSGIKAYIKSIDQNYQES